MQKDISTQQNDMQNIPTKDTGNGYELKGHVFNSHDAVVLFERSRKISTALYAVSNLYSDNVLKDRVRTAALDLLSAMTLMGNRHISKETPAATNVLQTIVLLRSCLEISLSTRQLSPMNAEILLEQIDRFSTDISQHIKQLEHVVHGVLGKNNTLHKDYFDVQVPNVENQPLIKSLGNISVKSSAARLATRTTRETSSQAHKIPTPEPTKIIIKASTKSDELKTKRHSNIIAFLRGNPNVPITDIVAFVGNVSSKTIQRDLNELIDRGIVAKEGSRRWSTYKLA